MKIFLLTSFVLLITIPAVCQSNYYYNGETASGTYVKYNCLRRAPINGQKSPVVTIANVTNKYDTVTVRRLDGKRITPGSKIEIADKTAMYYIVNDVFPLDIIPWFDSWPYLKWIFVLDTLGRVGEVQFTFREDSRWATIPPDLYYQFEQKLKQDMRFIITEDHLKQNVIKAIW